MLIEERFADQGEAMKCHDALGQRPGWAFGALKLRNQCFRTTH